jgi:hypothetical protein
MENRFWLGAGIFLAMVVCLAIMRHRHVTPPDAPDVPAVTTRAEAASKLYAPDNGPRPVVHGLPTSVDAGNLAMQWIEWTTAERNTGYRLSPVSEIESRLPALRVIRQKLADMPLQDDCARAAQRAELASMDADLTYFQMQVDIAHTPLGANPDLVKESEDHAAAASYAQEQNAGQMAMNCTTP